MKLIDTMKHRRNFDNSLFYTVCAWRNDSLNYMSRVQSLMTLAPLVGTRNQCKEEWN